MLLIDVLFACTLQSPFSKLEEEPLLRRICRIASKRLVNEAVSISLFCLVSGFVGVFCDVNNFSRFK